MRGRVIHYALIGAMAALAFLLCRIGGVVCGLIALAICGIGIFDDWLT